MNGNPLYEQIMHNAVQPQSFSPQAPIGPYQRMNMIMQAMQNPAAFVKQQFPDIPDEISGDPNQILQYLQRTRNISNDQINQVMRNFPRF